MAVVLNGFGGKMRINHNRSRLNKALTNREYKIMQMFDENAYCIICMKRYASWHYDCSPQNARVKHRHGNHKPIYPWHYRRYKTWKHSRKTQWKTK